METPAAPVCRSCAGPGLESILSLGRTPLANALLAAEQLDEPEETYPLDLVFCPRCALVQLLQTVPPEKLFREYCYFSSVADTALNHARDLAGELIETRRLGAASLVIEAASNDGYLLQFYHQSSVGVLGIEPARNVARVARARHGIDTLEEFFGAELAGRLAAQGRRANVFHAHNVLAHVADLNGFVRGIRTVLADDGVAVIEVPYVKDLIDYREFDTIYHEHLCYFSLRALVNLFARHDLAVQDVRRLAIHGGSLRLYVVPAGSAAPTPAVAELLGEEASWVHRLDFYQDFAERVRGLKASLCGLLGELKARGKRLAAYGASAKGSTLLNYLGIGRDTLAFVVDRSPFKQGYYTPGTHLPIHPPEKLLADMPHYVLLLTWNFAPEILRQQQEYRRRGGKFITFVPELQVV
jgi:SAM-dependent methyltransferase